jgi:hypothetical protein
MTGVYCSTELLWLLTSGDEASGSIRVKSKTLDVVRVLQIMPLILTKISLIESSSWGEKKEFYHV